MEVASPARACAAPMAALRAPARARKSARPAPPAGSARVGALAAGGGRRRRQRWRGAARPTVAAAAETVAVAAEGSGSGSKGATTSPFARAGRLASWLLYEAGASAGGSSAAALAPYERVADEADACEDVLREMGDDQLRALAREMREAVVSGEATEAQLMARAFALVREAARRVLGLRHFRVQMIGGACLAAGKIAEMGTGEGKTLVATLPVFLYALAGKVRVALMLRPPPGWPCAARCAPMCKPYCGQLTRNCLRSPFLSVLARTRACARTSTPGRAYGDGK